MVDEPPGPGFVTWLGFYMDAAFIISALASAPLLAIQLVRLRRASRLMAWWASGAAAGLALEVMFATGFDLPWVSPAYAGSAVLDWIYLVEAAGFLIAGAVMTWTVAQFPAESSMHGRAARASSS
jgi:hypothetical protein